MFSLLQLRNGLALSLDGQEDEGQLLTTVEPSSPSTTETLDGGAGDGQQSSSASMAQNKDIILGAVLGGLAVVVMIAAGIWMRRRNTATK